MAGNLGRHGDSPGVGGEDIGAYIPQYFINIIIDCHRIFHCLPPLYYDDVCFMCVLCFTPYGVIMNE